MPWLTWANGTGNHAFLCVAAEGDAAAVGGETMGERAATGEEVAMTSCNAERLPDWPATDDHVPVEELARQQGVRPLASADDLIQPGMFESKEELDEFLADLYASRRAGMA